MKILQTALARTNVEARDYQERLITKTLQMYDQPFKDRFGRNRSAVNSILVESPTGSGKTVIALLIALCMQQKHGLSVGWVAMRRNLLTQAAGENINRGFNVDMKLISMFDRDPPKVDFLVVDEAQHDGARSMASLHSKVAPKKLLGLTATPFRSDNIKLCFEQVNRDVGIEQLIQGGYLSRFHHYTIPRYTAKTVADTFLRERSRWGKSLLFFHRYEQCMEAQQRLAAADVKAEVVTATTDREQQIHDFATGKITVLISMGILAEGFDCPSLRTVFCRPSGKGCTIQMCGRVFRKHKRLKFKNIVQCGSTRYPITKTATPSEQYAWMDGHWKSLKLNEQMAAVSSRTLQLIADCHTNLPAFVIKNRKRSTRFDASAF